MFGAKGIAVYQLGNFETTSKRLDEDHQVFDLLPVSDDNKAKISAKLSAVVQIRSDS